MALIMASCNVPAGDAPALTQAALNTSAALTLAAITSQTATAASITSTATTAPTNTPVVSSPSPTNTVVTPAPLACNRAQFVSDVTVPDGTTFTPGSSFRKTWRLRNTGSCAWTSSYTLIFDNGERMNAPASVQLTTGSVAPDQTVDVSVDLVAPAAAGNYRGDFRLRSADNQLFGVGANGQNSFWVKIGVSTGTTDPATLFRNAQYRLNTNPPQVVQLVNGQFQQGAPGDVNYVLVNTTDLIVAGDLNADGVNEVIGPVVEYYGGTGKFVYLTLYEQVNQGLTFKTSFLVDDRPVLNALSIQSNQIVLDAIIHAPEDPLCCPTLNKVFRLRYVNGQLVE
jgi:hypothetical protein